MMSNSKISGSNTNLHGDYMTDRFDFEQQVMKCWTITDDLDVLIDGVMESDMTKDQIANALIGLRTMYDLKFNKLWDQFETLVRERKLT